MKGPYSIFLIALVIMACNKTQTAQASPVDSGSAAAVGNSDRPVAHILPVIPEAPQQILPVNTGQSNPAVLAASTSSDSSSASSSAAASGH